MGVGGSESRSIVSLSFRRCGVDEMHRVVAGVDRANAARLSGVRARVEVVAAARASGRSVLAREAMLVQF